MFEIERRAAADGTAVLRFVLPIDDHGRPIAVAGDFNGWDWTVTPLVAVDGQLCAEVTVSVGDDVQ